MQLEKQKRQTGRNKELENLDKRGNKTKGVRSLNSKMRPNYNAIFISMWEEIGPILLELLGLN